MVLCKIKSMLDQEEFHFLRENEHLGDAIILLTLGGSYAYGTYQESSDIDFRGVALERPQEIIGLSSFEQYENKKRDTVIYSFRKIIKLLLNCNPNVIELLGTDEDQVFICKPHGQLLRDNISLFLSRKAAQSFGGYATAQLRRLQNALARDIYPQKEKEEHMLKSINNQIQHLKTHYAPFGEGIHVYVDSSDKEDLEKELFIDVDLKKYPLRDFKNIFSEMTNVVKNYSKLTSRNKKKDIESLNKHAMHLVRLLYMGCEILEGKPVKTNRIGSPEYSLLIDIRQGKIPHPEIFALVDDLEKKFKYAWDHSPLPKKPNYKRVEELVMNVYRDIL